LPALNTRASSGPAHSSNGSDPLVRFECRQLPLTDAIAQAQTAPAQLSRWLEVAAKNSNVFRTHGIG